MTRLPRQGGFSNPYELRMLLNDATNHFGGHLTDPNAHGANYWRGEWIQRTYQKGDQVRDESWLMIANKQTTDRAAPQFVGNPSWILPELPVWEEQTHTGVVYSGLRLTVPAGQLFAVNNLRVWVQDIAAEAFYRVLLRNVDTGEVNVVYQFTGDIVPNPQWVVIPNASALIKSGQTFDVICQTLNSSSNTVFTWPWAYAGTSQTDSDPSAGNFNRNNQHTTFRINDLDDNGVDRGADLATVIPGSVIKAQVQAGTAYWEWTVIDNADQGGWHLFTVSLNDEVGGGPAVTDVCDVTFTVPVPALTKYVRIVDGNLPYSALDGVLALDDLDNAVFNDNAYGIDIYRRQYTVSPDWDIQASFTSDAGYLANSDIAMDYYLEVAKGNIIGESSINKFGNNPAVAVASTQTIWDGANAYTFPATADITHIRQSVDDAPMRGQTIEVQGLDVNWDAVIQNVVLDGTDTTTSVALTTPLRRVFRMKVLAGVVAAQNVELRNVGGGVTYAIIRAGANQTLMALYTVPNGHTAYIRNYYSSLNKDAGGGSPDVIISLWSQDNENGYAPQLKHVLGLDQDGTTYFNHGFGIPIQVSEKTDIYLEVQNLSGSATADVSGGFDLVIQEGT